MEAIEICTGEAHLQNKVTGDICYICHKEKDDNMALIRVGDKEFRFACLNHRGVVAEFVRIYCHLPIGFVQGKIEDLLKRKE